MLIIGGILMFVGGIACLVFWIMTIVKAFKANDTLWGVLSIFIPICGLIWLFMKSQPKLAVYWIIATVIYLVGFGLTMAGGFAAMEGMEGWEEVQQEEVQY